MNDNENAVCRLTGAALFNYEPHIEIEDKAAWEQIYNEFCRQAITGIPATLIDAINMPDQLRETWKRRIMQNTAQTLKLLHHQQELVSLLCKEKISYVILKGTAAAVYYPQPWLRTMGDVDFLVEPDDFDRAKALLIDNGFQIKEKYYMRHAPFSKYGIWFELHRFFASDDNQYGKELDNMLFEQIKNAETGCIQGKTFHMLPAAQNGIVLIQHIFHHLRFGIGLRQIIDWFCYVNCSLHDEQWQSFKEQTDKVGLTMLAKVVTRMGQLFFGMPTDTITWCLDVDARICQDLLEYIFKSGNFGKEDFKNNRIVYTMNNLQHGLFRTLQESGKYNWDAIKKHPWLENFAWLYQVVRYVRKGIQEKDTVGDFIKSQRRSRDLDGLMQKLNLQQK